MRKRLLKVLLVLVIILICGLFYAFLNINGLGFSCKFYDVTGLKCIGCGISRMCMSLLVLDFKSAFHYNFGLMSLSPIFAFLILRTFALYIKTGKFYNSKKQDILIIFILIYLLAYSIIRNIPYFNIF